MRREAAKVAAKHCAARTISPFVTAGRSRLKDGVASAHLCPAIRVFAGSEKTDVDARAKHGRDDRECDGSDIGITSRSRGGIRPSFSRHVALLDEEGAGNAGCTLHPRSRVQFALRKAHTSIQVQRRQSGIPCANGFTAYTELSLGTGFLAPIASVMRSIIADLTPASGRQDHTALPYANVPFAFRHLRVHRIPASRFVTIAKRPSYPRRDRASHTPESGF